MGEHYRQTQRAHPGDLYPASASLVLAPIACLEAVLIVWGLVDIGPQCVEERVRVHSGDGDVGVCGDDCCERGGPHH